MGTSKIEWTDNTWNPATGCTKVSAGCKNCYAERLYPRVYPNDNFNHITLHDQRLNEPFKWKKSRRIFVCSMSDLFHPLIPAQFLKRIYNVFDQTPQHIYLILTKRPDRMKEMWDNKIRKNVWLGVSVEDQKTADERISILLSIPAKVHFVSCEPLLETIDLELSGRNYGIDHKDWSERLDWVIVGAESGPKRRKCQLSWIDYIICQCRESSIPVFIKQIHYCGELINAKDFNNFFSKGLFPTEFPKE